MTSAEVIDFLYNVYNLDLIEEIIEQVKNKHLEGELTAAQKAALKILATYIDLIA